MDVSKQIHQESSDEKIPWQDTNPKREKKTLFKTPETLQKNPDQYLTLPYIMNKEDKTTQTGVPENFDVKVIKNDMSVDIGK